MELGGDYLFTHKSQTPVQQCELTANVILINCRVQIVVHYVSRVSGPSAVCVCFFVRWCIKKDNEKVCVRIFVCHEERAVLCCKYCDCMDLGY